MKMHIKVFSVLILSALLVWGGTSPAISQEKRVRAKIGIQIKSGSRSLGAKAKDRLRSGDLLRLYVHPEFSSYVYVVYTDQKTATLLNLVQQKVRSSTLVMPSIQEFYEVDGKSPEESFIIVCSQKELVKVVDLFSDTGEVSHEKWAEFEKELLAESRINPSQKADKPSGSADTTMAQKVEKPFAMAGNVRGLGVSGTDDPFIKKLQIFSGKSLLVRKYEFRVKK